MPESAKERQLPCTLRESMKTIIQDQKASIVNQTWLTNVTKVNQEGIIENKEIRLAYYNECFENALSSGKIWQIDHSRSLTLHKLT